MSEQPKVDLRDPGQAGLLALGALLVVVTPLCLAVAAAHAGLTWAGPALAVTVIGAGAAVARVARRASAPPRGTKP